MRTEKGEIPPLIQKLPLCANWVFFFFSCFEIFGNGEGGEGKGDEREGDILKIYFFFPSHLAT